MSLRYSEGDWFAVPLPDGGFGIGLIARANFDAESWPLGYFFGRWTEPPQMEDTQGLSAPQASLIRLISDVGLRDGTWPIIGRETEWSREHWPMPPFIRRPSLGSPELIIRAEDNTEVILFRKVIKAEEMGSISAIPEVFASGKSIAKALTEKI